MLRNIAAVLIALVALVSVYTPPRRSELRLNHQAGFPSTVRQVSCVKDALPPGVHHYGFLPPTPLLATLENIQGEAPYAQFGLNRWRLFSARYALTPDLVDNMPAQPWVIGFFDNREVGLKYLQALGWKIAKDCQNGVFLVKH